MNPVEEARGRAEDLVRRQKMLDSTAPEPLEDTAVTPVSSEQEEEVAVAVAEPSTRVMCCDFNV